MNIFEKMKNLLFNQQQKTETKSNPQQFKQRSYYTIERYNENGDYIESFNNIADAAKNLKVSRKTIQRICRGEIKNPTYNLIYGEKKQQEIVNYNNDGKW